MRVQTAPGRIFTIATTLVALAIITAPAWAGRNGQTKPAAKKVPPAIAAMQGKTAAQFYKNIKVLGNVPAEKLHDGMHYITAALGVRCGFCHEEGNFASDKKRNKRTARKMMRMLFAIAKDNFNGRTRVSCYTCHQGHEKPVPLPLPMETAASARASAMLMPHAKPIQPAPGTKIPTLNEILANYAKALGGKSALEKATSRVLEVERSGENGRPPITQEIYEKAPHKMLVVTHFHQRTFRTAYNGFEAWTGAGHDSRTLFGVEEVVPLREAQINPVASLAQYKALRLVAMARIGDQKAWVVSGRSPDGLAERLYFDTSTGLLVRRMLVYRTIFGRLLFEADYSDYRKTDGVAIPYKTDWWAGGSGWTDTVKSVKTNTPVENAEFNPPAKGPKPTPGGHR